MKMNLLNQKNIFKFSQTMPRFLAIKRNIHIGYPDVNKKLSFHLLGLSGAGLFATHMIINKHDDNHTKTQLTKKQAHSIVKNHTLGLDQPNLLEAAIVLNYYGQHAQHETDFFRGEVISQSVFDYMERNLDTVQELKKDTSITSNPSIAHGFSSRSLITQFLGDMNMLSKERDNKAIFYKIDIPKDFPIIKIPNDVYGGFLDDIASSLNECEYVIPKGTLIKVTKSKDNEKNDNKLHYTIHVLEDNLKNTENLLSDINSDKK